MKKLVHSINQILIAITLIGFGLTASQAKVLVIPPSPRNLAIVALLKQSDDDMVEVKRAGDTPYRTCFVYKSDNYASNVMGGHRPQITVSFTKFSSNDISTH